MRVLFLAAESVAAPVRILPLLTALRDAGRIDGFAWADRDMALHGEGGRFDAVLAHRNPSSRQFAWLRRSGHPFVYDIDDLLLLRSSEGLGRRRSRAQGEIRWCLTHAQAVTAPSRRLLTTLEQRLGLTLAERGVHLPNPGLQIPQDQRPRAKRPRLLWVSSADWQYEEMNVVSAGLNAAAKAIGTDVLLIGRFPATVREKIENQEHIPWLDPPQFAEVLAGADFIAAAPLPLALTEDEQEFVNCKSDIKAAQYGSLGIAGLYSPAPPYRDCDLPCVIAPSNTAADWRDGMIALAGGFPENGTKLIEHPAIAARRPELLAEQLYEALMRAVAAGGGAFTFRSLPTPAIFRGIERKIRSVRSRLTGKQRRITRPPD